MFVRQSKHIEQDSTAESTLRYLAVSHVSNKTLSQLHNILYPFTASAQSVAMYSLSVLIELYLRAV
jgi:hypothetical protein